MQCTPPGWLIHRRLSLRVLFAVLLLSALMTVLITAYQLITEYRRDVDALTLQLQQAEQTFADSLAGSLWALDEAQLRLQLQGIAQLSHVRRVELAGDLDINIGRNTTYPRQREHVIPIRYQADGIDSQELGELRIVADLAAIDARTRDRVIMILSSQAIKTFTVSLLLLIAFYYLITRHLHTLAAHARQLRVSSLLTPVRLKRSRTRLLRPDDLDELEAALNHAMVRMSEEMHQRTEAEKRLEFQSRFDPLTELPSRVLAYEHLTDLIHLCEPGDAVAAVFVDIDGFKDVNDSYGHELGDVVLVKAADRLRRACEPHWIPCRFSSDQFLVIIPQAPVREQLTQNVQTMLHRFSGPVTVSDSTLFIAATAGVAVFPDAGESAQALLQASDTALSLAKREQRGNLMFYSPQMRQQTRARLAMASELRQAVKMEAFELHFQPIIEIPTGRVKKLEALVRWPHPERGLISPAEFIPLAEESGLIVPLGRWVLRESLRHLTALRRMPGCDHLTMAVNISSQQLPVPGFVDSIRDVLSEFDLKGDALDLELTERGLIQDRPGTRAVLRELEALGVGLAIDDFGTGYSALNYLRHLPVNMLKIDREFVRDIGTDDHDALLVQAIISLAHALRLRVVAEGVETEEQLEFLRRHQCDFAQGYLYARPMPLEATRAYLSRNAGRHG